MVTLIYTAGLEMWVKMFRVIHIHASMSSPCQGKMSVPLQIQEKCSLLALNKPCAHFIPDSCAAFIVKNLTMFVGLWI